MVKRSSLLLHSLTKKRAYFQEVTIVVPATWSHQPEYKKIPDSDYFSTTANVRIAPPHLSDSDTPYTFQPGGCGELGQYIHMTTAFVSNYPHDGTNCQNCDELAQIFIHEWFHLRYGVFDEQGRPDNPRYPMFYLHNGEWVSREQFKTALTAFPLKAASLQDY